MAIRDDMELDALRARGVDRRALLSQMQNDPAGAALGITSPIGGPLANTVNPATLPPPRPPNSGVSGYGPGGTPPPAVSGSALPPPTAPAPTSHVTGTVNGKPVDVPGADELGNPLNSPAYIEHLNATHPEYGGGKALPDPAAPPTPPKGLGSYANQLEGFDTAKLNDPTHNSPKYLIGRALSNFDPRKGVTPEVLAALNALGIGEFSGSGDSVSIKNGDPRFEGVNAIDLVHGFNDPNGKGGWQYGISIAGARANGTGATAQDAAASPMVGDINIQTPGDNTFFNKLMDQARALTGPTDRNALLALMRQ